MVRKALLSCGILSSVFYAGINILVPRLFEGYDISSQTVSELSAIGAPTRSLWVPLAMIYILLFAAFVVGIWMSAGANKSLKIVSRLTTVYAVVNLYWPPMHLRGNLPTLTDTLHIAWAVVTIVLMILTMVYGAAALGKPFRMYTVVTLIVFIVCGLLIGREAPGIPRNLPTPNIGTWERINIGAFMLWIIVFSIALLKQQFPGPQDNRKRVHVYSVNTENKSRWRRIQMRDDTGSQKN